MSQGVGIETNGPEDARLIAAAQRALEDTVVVAKPLVDGFGTLAPRHQGTEIVATVVIHHCIKLRGRVAIGRKDSRSALRARHGMVSAVEIAVIH